MTVCAHTTCLLKKYEDWRYFCIRRAELRTPIKNSSLNLKKLKQIAADVQSWAYPMVTLSG
jgi:hypothetical protein